MAKVSKLDGNLYPHQHFNLLVRSILNRLPKVYDLSERYLRSFFLLLFWFNCSICWEFIMFCNVNGSFNLYFTVSSTTTRCTSLVIKRIFWFLSLRQRSSRFSNAIKTTSRLGINCILSSKSIDICRMKSWCRITTTTTDTIRTW